MSTLVPLILFAWIPLVVGLFVVLPPRRAVIAAFLVAWLFLPVAGYSLPGLPDYTKMSATCLGVLLGAALFDAGRLTTFRMRWVDLPMGIWCVVPFASSIHNGLGVYDGVSALLNQSVVWGLPYLIGRVYFNNLASLRELAVGLFIGGLVYVPLCLYEIRMSPQLHTWLYGFHQHSFVQTIRYGGWRPTVFMQHGLMVGMWMCMTALTGYWLWCTGSVKRIWGIPIVVLLGGLTMTAVLCKSFGALALGVVGAGVLWTSVKLNTRWLMVGLIGLGPVYMAVRAGGLWSGEELVALAGTIGGEERAGSLQFRMLNEDMLATKALQRPIFGWGGWGRARVYDERGRDMTVTDGLWIIALGNHGVVGLGGLTAALILPGWLVVRRWPPATWQHPALGSVIVLAVMTTLYFIDCIANAMLNPIFTLVVGGVTATAWSRGTVMKSTAQLLRRIEGRHGVVTSS